MESPRQPTDLYCAPARTKHEQLGRMNANPTRQQWIVDHTPPDTRYPGLARWALFSVVWLRTYGTQQLGFCDSVRTSNSIVVQCYKLPWN